jgi:hypothetical protein
MAGNCAKTASLLRDLREQTRIVVREKQKGELAANERAP